MTSANRPWRRILALLVLALVLGLTFWAYLRPDLMIDLANVLWSCM